MEPPLKTNCTIPGTPKLVPVFAMKLQLLGPPQTLFKYSTIESNMAVGKKGRITTIQNEFGFEFDVTDIAGYDNITAYIENGYSKLDIHLHGETKTGEDILIQCFGIYKSLPEVEAVLSGKASSHSFEDSYLSVSPQITFIGKTPEKYAWLEKENLIAKGRFLFEDGNVFVEYFTYVMR